MLRTENIVKSFGKREILHGISVDLSSGVYGLLGPNGSGKTTFIRCLLGAYRCTGKVIFQDKPVTRKNPLTGHIGYLPQKFGMYRELKVYEALEYMAALKNVDIKKTDGEIRRCLDLVNMAERAENKMGSLSGGMVRRVGIAAALLGDPEILIFDEPTAGLDPEERMRFKNCIRGLKKDRVVVISTHILEDVQAVCDRILVMNGGNIRRNCPLEDIAREAVGKVFTVSECDLGDTACEVVSVQGEGAQKSVRILTATPNEFMKPEIPTVEDGYLAVIKGL